MNNKEKQNQYAILMSKLKRATKYENYYEAIFIEYAILEDRASSILKHAKVNVKTKKKNGPDLFNKLNAIKIDKKFDNEYRRKHLPDEYLDEIQNWRQKRNTFVHNLIETKYNSKEVKKIALEGECYATKFSNKSSLLNKHYDKIK